MNTFSNDSSVEVIRRRLLALLESSALPLPPPRRIALMEACRQAMDGSELLDMSLEALGDSTYLSSELKDRVMESILTGDWEVVQSIVNASANSSGSGAESSSSSSSPQQEPMAQQRRNDSSSEESSSFLEFRRMAITIFYASRKIQQLPLTARRQLGSAILRTQTREALMDLFLTRLEHAVTLDEESRMKIANDVLERRYYRLLLPDRFDCESGSSSGDGFQHGELLQRQQQFQSSDTRVSSGGSPFGAPLVEVENVWIDENTQDCPICLGEVNRPTTLHCNHVFCRDCILDWAHQEQDIHHPQQQRRVTATRQRHADIAVSCPLCREPGTVPAPGSSPLPPPPPPPLVAQEAPPASSSRSPNIRAYLPRWRVFNTHI